MNRNNLNVSNIENYLHTVFDNVVSDNTYVGTLPDTIDSKWQDMVLIDLGTSVRDYDAMGKCIIHIYLYAKPLANGSKNVKVMSELEDKFNEALALARENGEEYQLNHAYDDSDFDSQRKWHFNIKALNLLIL